MHNLLNESLLWFICFCGADLIGYKQAEAPFVHVKLLIMRLYFVDCENTGIVIHELLDLSPVAEPPQQKSIEKTDLVKHSPSRVIERKLEGLPDGVGLRKMFQGCKATDTKETRNLPIFLIRNPLKSLVFVVLFGVLFDSKGFLMFEL